MSNKTETFFEQVYDIVRLIPKGRVTTYGAIAKTLGSAQSARLVGTALMLAHDPRLKLPIHRVVNRNGLLTGTHHYDSPTHMQELLESEGLKIVEDQIQDLSRVLWHPLVDL